MGHIVCRHCWENCRERVVESWTHEKGLPACMQAGRQAHLDVLITLLRKETEAAAGPSAASATLSASPARAAHEITGLHWGAEFLPIAETSLSIFRYVTSGAVSSAPSCCRTLSVRSCLVFSRHSYYLMVGRRPKSYFILGPAPVLSFTCYLLLRPVALFCLRDWP